jgi:hypothetical protein
MQPRKRKKGVREKRRGEDAREGKKEDSGKIESE